jgi:hypothetical protein
MAVAICLLVWHYSFLTLMSYLSADNLPAEVVAPQGVPDGGYLPCAALTAAQSWHFVYLVRNGLECPEGPAGGQLEKQAPEDRGPTPAGLGKDAP